MNILRHKLINTDTNLPFTAILCCRFALLFVTSTNTDGNKHNGQAVMEYQALFSYMYRYLNQVYSFPLGTNTYKF
jgi:hypothetical protein